MRKILLGSTLLTPLETLPDHALVIHDGHISAILPQGELALRPDDEIIPADGLWAAPGLIDLHIHGCNGADTMDAEPETFATMGRFLAQHGVTAFTPTTISQRKEAIGAVIRCFQAHQAENPEAPILGLHLEGPYLNPRRGGAQPAPYLRHPDRGEYLPWLESGAFRLVSLAPELPGALEMIQSGREYGVHFAVAHSEASYELMQLAADAGLDQAAHTFNAMGGLHHREPGTSGAVLTDERIFAQVIADGLHLHPAIVKLVVRAKGLGRTLLVSDAMRAAGLSDGEYDLGGQAVLVQEGEARTPAGSLAGSTLTLDAAVRNAMRFARLTFPEALRMATLTPAQALGIQAHKGSLHPGADADIVLFDRDQQVQMTIIGGEVIYRKR